MHSNHEPSSGGVLAPTRRQSTVVNALIVAALIGGGLITAWGATQLDWPSCIHYTPYSLGRTALFLAGAAVVLALSAMWLGRPVWLMAGIAALGIAIASRAGGQFVWTAVCALSVTVLGTRVLGLIGLTVSHRSAFNLVALAVGSTLLGATTELCASLPGHHPATYAIAVLIPIVLWRGLTRTLIADFTWPVRRLTRPHGYRLAAESCVASLSLFYAASALFPEVEHDALLMHLAIPAEMSRNGQWHFDHQNFTFVFMPKLANWLYSVGYMLGGEASARLINCGFILAGACAIYWITRLASVRQRHYWGLAAAALFLSTPLAYREATSLFVESVWTFLVLAAALVCVSARQMPQRAAALTVACVLMCGAATTKPQGLVTCAAFACAFGPWALGSLRQITIRQGIAIALAISLIAATPYLRAWIETGNPVYPFFNGIFKAAGVPPDNVTDMWRSPLDWRLLYQLTFESGKFLEGYPGAIGFQWMVLLPVALIACVASRNRSGTKLAAFGMVTFAAMFLGSRYLRYVFPALAVLIAVTGIGLSAVGRRFRIPLVVVVAACIGLNGLFLHSAGRKYPDFPIETLVSEKHREAFLERRAPIRLAISLINSLNRDGSSVAFLSPAYGAELASTPLYANHVNVPFLGALLESKSADELAAYLCSRGVAFIIIDGSWRSDRVRALVELISVPIAQFADAQVRRIGEQHCLSEEALADPDFSKGSWSIPPGERGCGGIAGSGVRVTVDQPATQRVIARAGSKYVLSIDASGTEGSSLCRTQVVWLNAEGRTVRVDIEVFTAEASGSSHTMRGRAPADAELAIVYATSHDLRPVCVQMASLKWAP